LDKSKRALIEANAQLSVKASSILISLFEAGITNVVARRNGLYGKLRHEFLSAMSMKWSCVSIPMPQETKAAERSLEALLQNGLFIRVVELPADEDPDSMIRSEVRKHLKNA